MAQKNWHLTQGVRNHIVGIYHGEESGHVVVHCNNRIIIIDFSVLQSKTYKFFIDQELYELEIEKELEAFKYKLRVDYEADTNFNRERNAYQKSERLEYFASLGFGLLLLLSLFTYFYFRYK